MNPTGDRVFNVNKGDVMTDPWIVAALDDFKDDLQGREIMRELVEAGQVVVTRSSTGEYFWKMLAPDDRPPLPAQYRRLGER